MTDCKTKKVFLRNFIVENGFEKYILKLSAIKYLSKGEILCHIK